MRRGWHGRPRVEGPVHHKPTGEVIMTAAAGRGGIVATRFRWWPAIASAILIGLGAYLFAAYWGRADAEYRFTVIFSKNPEFLWKGIAPFVANALSEALHFDHLVILGYFLALITCATVFRYLAFSESGKRLSRYVLAAAGVATFAHILEDG